MLEWLQKLDWVNIGGVAAMVALLLGNKAAEWFKSLTAGIGAKLSEGPNIDAGYEALKVLDREYELRGLDSELRQKLFVEAVARLLGGKAL